MKKQKLTIEQKRADTDIGIISFVTLGVFMIYAILGNDLMRFVKNRDISVSPRLLLNAAVQFGVAGLGITVVCILRKEKFSQYGLTNKNTGKSILGTVICFVPNIVYTLASGQSPAPLSVFCSIPFPFLFGAFLRS